VTRCFRVWSESWNESADLGLIRAHPTIRSHSEVRSEWQADFCELMGDGFQYPYGTDSTRSWCQSGVQHSPMRCNAMRGSAMQDVLSLTQSVDHPSMDTQTIMPSNRQIDPQSAILTMTFDPHYILVIYFWHTKAPCARCAPRYTEYHTCRQRCHRCEAQIFLAPLSCCLHTSTHEM
jgi:hypothetical protein